MSENNHCTASNNCSPGACSININCGCQPCTPNIFTTVQAPQNILAPVLGDNIVSCVSLDGSQYMRSSPITFTIDNP